MCLLKLGSIPEEEGEKTEYNKISPKPGRPGEGDLLCRPSAADCQIVHDTFLFSGWPSGLFQPRHQSPAPPRAPRPPLPALQLSLLVTCARCPHPPPLLLQPPTHRGPRGPSLSLDLSSCALQEPLGDGGATRGSRPHTAGPTGASCHLLPLPPPRPVLPRPPGLPQLPRQSAHRLTPGPGPPTRPGDPGSEWAQLMVHSGLAVITVKEDAPALNVASLRFEKCIRPRAQLSSQDVDLVCHPSPVRPPPDFCRLRVPLPVLEFRGNGMVQMAFTPGALLPITPIHPPRGRVAGSLFCC